jgi:FkbM family methyltransferase
MRSQVNNIIREINREVDIVWSFDLNNLYRFDHFPPHCLKVFHPVDEPLNANAINAAVGSDIIFSVTNDILQKYSAYRVPKFLINHGIADDFIQPLMFSGNSSGVYVGLSGNLLRKDIDRAILLEILSENPEVTFEFWGSYETRSSNIGGTDDEETTFFIKHLKTLPNVILHGAVPSTELAKAIQRMDAFLICYDVKKDQSKGTNYHKVIEYLATGKVIVSNNISSYSGKPELVQMVSERDNNEQLPILLNKVLGNLPFYNSYESQQIRREFAKNNTYDKQLERIEKIIDKSWSSSSIKNKQSISLSKQPYMEKLNSVFSKLGSFKGKLRLARLLYKSKIARSGPYLVQAKDGLEFMVPNIYENISFEILVNGYYEKELVQHLIKHIPRNGCFVDVGVNIGSISIPLAKKRADVQIYGFEASPRVYSYLQENVKRNGCKNIHIYNNAIHWQEGMTLNFYSPEEKFGKGSLAPVYTSNSESVLSKRLDKFFEEQNLQPDYMKVDVEGFESFVFKSLSNYIANNNNKKPVVIFEFADWAEENALSREAIGEAQEVISSYGYKIYDFDEYHLPNIQPLKNIIKKGSANLIAVA